MLYFKKIFLKRGQRQKHGNYKEKCKGNYQRETQFWVGFFNPFKWRSNLDIHLKGLTSYETGAEERAIISRRFISAKHHWNYTWRLGIGLTFSKTGGITVQTGMLHPSCAFLLLSGRRPSLEHLKDNKEINWYCQVCPSLGHDLEIWLFSGWETEL